MRIVAYIELGSYFEEKTLPNGLAPTMCLRQPDQAIYPLPEIDNLIRHGFGKYLDLFMIRFPVWLR